MPSLDGKRAINLLYEYQKDKEEVRKKLDNYYFKKIEDLDRFYLFDDKPFFSLRLGKETKEFFYPDMVKFINSIRPEEDRI